MQVCEICGEPFGGSLHHDISPSEAAHVVRFPCPKGNTHKNVIARCRWGAGDYFLICGDCGYGWNPAYEQIKNSRK